MDELVAIMGEIRDQLVALNSKIDKLTSNGSYDISDVCNKLDVIDSSLGTIDSSLSLIDTTIAMKD